MLQWVFLICYVSSLQWQGAPGGDGVKGAAGELGRTVNFWTSLFQFNVHFWHILFLLPHDQGPDGRRGSPGLPVSLCFKWNDAFLSIFLSNCGSNHNLLFKGKPWWSRSRWSSWRAWYWRTQSKLTFVCILFIFLLIIQIASCITLYLTVGFTREILVMDWNFWLIWRISEPFSHYFLSFYRDHLDQRVHQAPEEKLGTPDPGWEPTLSTSQNIQLHTTDTYWFIYCIY